MQPKLDLIKKIFTTTLEEGAESTPMQEGKYFGGVYNGRKFLYSEQMLEALSIEKLETFIRRQTGILI